MSFTFENDLLSAFLAVGSEAAWLPAKDWRSRRFLPKTG
jgi:hypothetical protein